MISAVIPVRNGAQFINEAVKSALDQGDLVGEVIVVDDGSTDDTVAIVRRLDDPRIRLMSRPAGKTGGVSAVRNIGLAAARGEWLVFLDADDRLRPGALAALLAAAEGHVAVYGDYQRIDAAGDPVGSRHLVRRQRHKPHGHILEKLLAGNVIVNGGVLLIRTEAFRTLGGFDETLRYCEDWYAWCRLAASGSIGYVQGVHVLDYRLHGKSAMMADVLTLADYRPALDAVFSDALLMADLPAARRRALRRSAEAHLSTYLVAQAVRSRRYLRAARGLLATIIRHPRRSPQALLMSGAAIAGF